MPFIPHTEADVAEMLAEIGVADIDALFDEIPADLVSDQLNPRYQKAAANWRCCSLWPRGRNKTRAIPALSVPGVTTTISRQRYGTLLPEASS